MDLEQVKKYQFPVIHDDYDSKDSILYALGLGYGSDPMNKQELRFVTEDEQLVVPSQCNVMAYPGFWMRDVPQLGIDWVRVLHGEQMIEILRPLPVNAKVEASPRIIAVDDKGKDKGAAIYVERAIRLADSGEIVAIVRSTVFARGDGGQGGFGEPPSPPAKLADGEPDRVFEIATSTRAALIYRLSGDLNPVHSDPDIARQAGFERPILHGLCTMGIACRAVIECFCNFQPERLNRLFVRFSQPVYPGETLRFEFFGGPREVRFRARVAERDAVVLDRCTAGIAA